MASPIESAQPTSQEPAPVPVIVEPPPGQTKASSGPTLVAPAGSENKTAESIVADLDFDKQLRKNLATFIPLLFLSLGIVGVGAGLSTQAALDILAEAANNTELYNDLADGSVPKTNFFLIGTIVGGFGLFVLMVVVVQYLDKRERIVNRRKIIEEEQRLQKLKAKPKNIFDVLLSAARGNKTPQQQSPVPK